MEDGCYPLVLSVEQSVSRPEDAASALERLNPLLRQLIKEAKALEATESGARWATGIYTKMTCGFTKVFS